MTKSAAKALTKGNKLINITEAQNGKLYLPKGNYQIEEEIEAFKIK